MLKLSQADEYRGLAIVAFIDLLGYSEYVNKNWKSGESEALDTILKMKREFLTEPGGAIIRIKGHNDHDKARYVPHIINISDSFVFVTRFHKWYQPLDMFGAVAGLCGAVISLARLTTKHGFAIRGGVELENVYQAGSEIIGPAFNAAYTLEAKIAKRCRVVVGPNFMATTSCINDATTMLCGLFNRDADNMISIHHSTPDLIEPMIKIRDNAPENVRYKYEYYFSNVAKTDFCPTKGQWRKTRTPHAQR